MIVLSNLYLDSSINGHPSARCIHDILVPRPASMAVVYNISLQRPNPVGQYRDHNGPRISNQSLDGICFIWLLVISGSMN